MRRKQYLLPLAILIIAITVLAGCGSKDLLADTQWLLVDLGDRLPLAEVDVTLSFADGKVGGSAGCNNYGGEYTLKGEEISFGPMASTLMACMEEGVMAQESLYLQRLAQVETYSLESGMLVLYLADGSLMSFSR